MTDSGSQYFASDGLRITQEAFHDDAQRSTLSALVGEVSKTGLSRQKAWERVKKDLGVRRIQDIRRGDFGRAQELLLRDAG
ncbi:MAG: hypothetical protein HQL99_15355 [Magnetococcales bacterium]|nr:hypothetical protein [Magnetococcales bacterium]